MSRGLILSVGTRSDLLATRNRVLESYGYIVVPAYTPEQAMDQLRESDFDVAILCHTLGADDRERLIGAMKKAKPLMPVLTVESGGYSQRPELADEAVAGIDGPEALFAHIEAALSRFRSLGSNT